MRKVTAITSFIQDMSYLIDHGAHYSISEVNKHIEDKDLVDWLEKEFPFGMENGLDFSMFKRAHRDYLHDEYESIWCCYAGNERRKW